MSFLKAANTLGADVADKDSLHSQVRLMLTLTRKLEHYLHLISLASTGAVAKGNISIEDMCAIVDIANDCEGWLQLQREKMLLTLAESDASVLCEQETAEALH